MNWSANIDGENPPNDVTTPNSRRYCTYEQVCRILVKVTIIPHHNYIDFPKNILLPCRFWYVNSQPTGEAQFSNFKNWLNRKWPKVIVRMLLTMGHIFERLISFGTGKGLAQVGSWAVFNSFDSSVILGIYKCVGSSWSWCLFFKLVVVSCRYLSTTTRTV